MSKIKQELERQQEVQMEYEYKFMEFIYDNLVSSELSDLEINELEEDQQRPSTMNKVIVSKPSLNNQTYDNKLGDVSWELNI